jgi:glyoxylase-like metal-dependent hydrolase (beta-lactamase superfamily II)
LNPTDVSGGGSEFDGPYDDGAAFTLGSLSMRVMHTPACVTYVVDVGNRPFAGFVGDTLFMPDFGTARADCPGGDAGELFRPVRSVLARPEATKPLVCHDYETQGRDHFDWERTVAERRAANMRVKDGVIPEVFVLMRRGRDAKLVAPVLLLPSIQVNVPAGKLPQAESNVVRYLKTPVRLAG